MTEHTAGKTFALIAILAGVAYLGWSALTPATAPSDARTELAGFVATADDLYKRAKVIVDLNPTTDDQADQIAVRVGNQWGVDEHGFQTSFFPMLKGGLDYPADVREGLVRIAQFDNFVFDAISSSYSCQNMEAHRRLAVAGQLLEHAKMALQGHPDPDWDPNLDWPDDHGQCRR